MTERTYSGLKLTDIETLADGALGKAALQDCAAHIRELQAENAKLEYRLNATKEREDTLMSEVIKLKAERREFGVRVGKAIIKAYFSGKHNNVPIETIVKQELNK